MTSHFLLLSDALTQERLSWTEEVLKYYFIQISPDALRRVMPEKSPTFVIFLTGDALYSLFGRETREIWEIILSLPSLAVICDQQDLDLRGLSLESLYVKYPGLVSSRKSVPEETHPSFWCEVIDTARVQAPDEKTIGFLQVQSPYMHRSALYALLCLEAALDRDCDPELYAFLDGIHIGHANQHPTSFRNLGEGLSDLASHALQQQRHHLFLGSALCAIERGYGMWDNGKGLVLSPCTIKPLKLKSLTDIVERFTKDHSILGTNSGSFQMRQDHAGIAEGVSVKDHSPPALVILITGSPYINEMAMGALSFAIASAHKGIATRVVFIEDGVYVLSGNQKNDAAEQFFSLQDMVNSASRNDRIEFFVHQPSLHQRGIIKNKKFNAVLDMNNIDLANLFFESPTGEHCRYQRVLFF